MSLETNIAQLKVTLKQIDFLNRSIVDDEKELQSLEAIKTKRATANFAARFFYSLLQGSEKKINDRIDALKGRLVSEKDERSKYEALVHQLLEQGDLLTQLQDLYKQLPSEMKKTLEPYIRIHQRQK
ncbi:MAG: hypothetical protein KGJ02_02035 [Verrucomicrobiota bacterium]|nr:hypothetical protein [Verrucomicrobiota bacterium]